MEDIIFSKYSMFVSYIFFQKKYESRKQSSELSRFSYFPLKDFENAPFCEFFYFFLKNEENVLKKKKKNFLKFFEAKPLN